MGTWMCVPVFVIIQKSQRIGKVIIIHPPGTVDVGTNFHGNSSNCCWDNSVWTADIVFPKAMLLLLLGLKMQNLKKSNVLWDINYIQSSFCDRGDAQYLIRVVYLLTSGIISRMLTARCVQSAPKLICIMSLATALMLPQSCKKQHGNGGKGWIVKSNDSYLVITFHL